MAKAINYAIAFRATHQFSNASTKETPMPFYIHPKTSISSTGVLFGK